MEKCNHISVNTSNFIMKFIIPNSNGDNKAKPVLDAFINDLSCMFTLALTTASVVKSWNKRIQICQTILTKILGATGTIEITIQVRIWVNVIM